MINTKHTDEKINKRINAAFYKGISYALIAITVIEAFLIIVISSQKTTNIPYVIEINRDSEVKYIKNAVSTLKDWEPSSAITIKTLSDYLESLRGVSVDENIQKKRIRNIYQFSTADSVKLVDEYFKMTNPLERGKTEYVDITVYAATPGIHDDKNIYQLDFNEKTYTLNGKLKNEENYRAIIKTQHFIPRTETQQITNPLGIYVSKIKISKIKDGYVLYESK